MQTFLPYPGFYLSARCLDNRRLGKQRVEAFQILKALRGESRGWVNHPATRMWRGHEVALQQYLRACILCWKDRGFRNTMEMPEYVAPMNFTYPAWFGRADLHASHRSNLLRKDPAWYSQFGWTETPDSPYIWPA